MLQGLEAATNCVDDMDEWLGIFNVKLRHMREDIESVENNIHFICSSLLKIPHHLLGPRCECILDGFIVVPEYISVTLLAS